jgi:hypothetical protein
VLSPDQRWVAFICGLHGVVVMKVPDNPGVLMGGDNAPKAPAP